MLKLATRWSKPIVGLALMLATGLAQAQGPARLLQGVDVVAQQGDRVLLTLTLSDSAPQPAVFTVDKPARISIDLPDTGVALAERYK
ncbi:MAG: type IV pilus secretin PilQ, partial [Solimonas sp.]